MPALSLNAYVIPSGGAVGLQFATSTSGMISLSRAVSGGSFTSLYSGAPLMTHGQGQFYLDVGDQLPGPLDPSLFYVYQLSDITGTVQTPGIQAVNSVNIEQDSLTTIFMRIIQGGVNTQTLPPGISVAQIIQAMPINSLPPLPSIVVTPELVQQHYVPIGADVPQFIDNKGAQANVWTLSEQADRTYRVSVLSGSATEREFYRDAVIAWFRIMLSQVLQPMGYDITHRYQAAMYQVSDQNSGQTPGFYGCDISCEFTGSRNVAVVTNYGPIAAIMVSAAVSDQTIQTASLPPTGTPF